MPAPAATKRKASALAKGKGKALSAAAPPAKRLRQSAPAAPPHKASNRPTYAASASSHASSDDDDDDEGDESDDRAAMLAALEAHQASFLAGALPMASTSAAAVAPALKPVKSVWEMDEADFEDEEDEEEEDEEDESAGGSDEDENEGFEDLEGPKKGASAAAVVAFVEPGREATSSFGASPAPLNKREIRDFKAGKVKNLHVKPSIADAANAKYVGGRAKQKALAATGLGGTPGKGGAQSAEAQEADAAEENHLSKLDSHLSSLIKPLTSGSSASLPDLLRELPLAPTKALKGHTPLPKNAPRLLRKGQNAANLKRAQLRDAAAGHGQGAKKGSVGMGREALSLKEKRKADGLDKRQRGLGGAVGKWGRGQISLSKKEIMRINGPE